MSLVKLALKVTQTEMDAANAKALQEKAWEIHPQTPSGIKPLKPTSKLTQEAESKGKTILNKIKPHLTGKNLGIIGGSALIGYGLHKLTEKKEIK